MNNSPLKKTLDQYPEIKKEFDLTVEKHSDIRGWFAWWLKKVRKFKTSFDEMDVQAYRLAFFKIRQREFTSTNELYAACNSIVPDAYRTIETQTWKKRQKREIPSMGDILKNL